MPHENFRIRIRKDGVVLFLSRELGDERMRELRDMIESCLGPIAEVRSIEGDDLPPPGVALVDEEKSETLRKRK